MVNFLDITNTPVQVQGHDAALWRPSEWYDALQPVADLLRVTSDLLRTDELVRVQQRQELLDTLATAADTFEPGREKSQGCRKFVCTVQDLLR